MQDATEPEESFMNADVLKLWPELEWIRDEDLREKTARTWELALERSALDAEDLETIPFTLLVPNLKVSFMAHKRCVVHVARESALKMNEFFGDDLHCDMDTGHRRRHPGRRGQAARVRPQPRRHHRQERMRQVPAPSLHGRRSGHGVRRARPGQPYHLGARREG